MVDFKDSKSFEDWAKRIPQSIQTVLTIRTALRVWPFITVLDGKPRNPFWKFVAGRVLLTFYIDTYSSTPELRSAVNVAAQASRRALMPEVNGIPPSATEYVPRPIDFFSSKDFPGFDHLSGFGGFSDAISAATDQTNLLEHISDDFKFIESRSDIRDLIRRPLWTSPNPLKKEWQEARRILENQNIEFSFWIDWYERILDGRQQNWEMLKEIALIDPKDWDQGAEHVNGIIAGIQAKYLLSATPLAERMEVNPDTGRLRVVPEPMREADLYQNALEKVRDSIEDLREGGLKNAHSALAPILEKLDRIYDRYIDSPQRMHDEFLKARQRAQRLVAAGELADDDDISDFLQDLDTGAVDIRGAMPLVAQAVSRRATLRLRELGPDKQDVVRAGVEAVAEISEPELAEQLREDIVEVLNGEILDAQGDRNLDAVDATDRTGSRLARTYDLVKRSGGGIVGGYGVAAIILEAIKVLAPIFGL